MRNFSRTLTALLVVAAFGCESKEDAPPAASQADEVGRPLSDLELPVSHRSGDAAPTNAAVVESTSEQMRVDGAVVSNLERGLVPEKEHSNGVMPKLSDKIRGRSALALRMQANLPYETVALVLSTAKKAGVRDVRFNVRPVGGEGAKTGWIDLGQYVMSSKAEDLPEIPGTKARSWNDFTDKWEEIFDGCRSARTGNCAYVTDNFAEGGTLRLELMASGRGININFFRRGLSPEQQAEEEEKRAAHVAAKKQDFLDGRIDEDEMMQVLMLGRPATYALFQFRYQEALSKTSPITGTMAPVCRSRECGVVVTADKVTRFVNLISLLGAAFPDGTPTPGFAFEMPWTKRPQPEDLAAFIERQQNL
jgi:hypothetical protein